MDLTKLVIRFANSTATTNYAYSASALADALGGSSSFATTWIRGTGTNAVMQPGDLVELHFNMNNAGPYRLATRTPVEISLVPETGAPVAADFKTPSTYGSDLIITLR
jgi:archaellin